MKMRKN